METPSWNSPPPTFILLKWRKSNIESPKWHQISKPYISTFRPYGSYGFLGYIGIYLFREKFGGRDRDVCHTNPNPPTPPGAEVSLMHPKWSSSNPMVPQGLFNDPTKSPPKILVKKRRNTHTHTHPVVVDFLPYICWSVFVCWISDCVSFFGNETRLLYMARAEGKDESVEETCR